MDAAQWPQQQVAGLARTMEDIPTPPSNNPNNINLTNNNTNPRAPILGERKARPQKDHNVNCPRCNSTNTKFCYYNNYSLTQPRYFCKTCRRYWTQGGSLRNVPVGGGSRKNKRSSSSSSNMLASSSSSLSSSITTSTPSSMPNKLIPDLNPPTSFSQLLTSTQNPKFLQGHDLNLAFPMQGMFHPLDQHHQLPKMEVSSNNTNENHEPVHNNSMNNGNINNSSTTSCTTTSTSLSALELLRTGMASRGGMNSFVPMPLPSDSNTLYPSGFPNLQEFKPTNMGMFSSAVSGDHHVNDQDNNMMGSGGNNNSNNRVGGGARLLFPFADMNKLASSTTTSSHNELTDDQSKGSRNNDHHHHHNQHHHQGPTAAGYWSGMLGGGTW